MERKKFSHIILIHLTFFICFPQINAQPHFNNLYQYPDVGEFSRDIHRMSNGNVLNLSGGRLSNGSASGRIIRMLDDEGNLLWEDYINVDTTSLFGNWQHTSQVINDSLLVIVGPSSQDGSSSYHWPYFLKYDLLNQSLLDIKFYPTENGSSIFSTIFHTDGYLYATGIFPTNASWEFEDIYLLKIDVDGNLIWTNTFDYDQSDRAFEIETFENDLIISGITSNLIDQTEAFISIIDTSGAEKFHARPTNFGSSGIIGTEIINDEIFFTTESEIILDEYKTQYISKWDNELNLIWEYFVPNTSEYGLKYRAFEILDDQIIIAGNITGAKEYTSNSEIIDWSYISGWSLDGELLWEHEVFYDETWVHHIDDIINTDDGDLIFMGTVFTKPENDQKMWLFKTDSDGCGIVQDTCYYTLEEYFGIDTIVSVEDNFTNANPFIVLGNNPISDMLSFKVSNSYYNKLKYSIIDITGRLILESEINQSSMLSNINIDTKEWPNGLYILKVSNKGKLIWQEKVMKSN